MEVVVGAKQKAVGAERVAALLDEQVRLIRAHVERDEVTAFTWGQSTLSGRRLDVNIAVQKADQRRHRSVWRAGESDSQDRPKTKKGLTNNPQENDFLRPQMPPKNKAKAKPKAKPKAKTPAQPRTCGACGLVGHIRSNSACPAKSGGTDRTCGACGAVGHIATNSLCPARAGGGQRGSSGGVASQKKYRTLDDWLHSPDFFSEPPPEHVADKMSDADWKEYGKRLFMEANSDTWKAQLRSEPPMPAVPGKQRPHIVSIEITKAIIDFAEERGYKFNLKEQRAIRKALNRGDNYHRACVVRSNSVTRNTAPFNPYNDHTVDQAIIAAAREGGELKAQAMIDRLYNQMENIADVLAFDDSGGDALPGKFIDVAMDFYSGIQVKGKPLTAAYLQEIGGQTSSTLSSSATLKKSVTAGSAKRAQAYGDSQRSRANLATASKCGKCGAFGHSSGDCAAD